MQNVIQISGGADSLAVLRLLRPIWDDAVVMWCNTGAAYAGTVALMRRIAAAVPHFLEVKSDQPANLRTFGFPMDVVPFKYSAQGELVHGPQPVKYQSIFDCCGRNIWVPLHNAVMSLGAKMVYRGQRADDRRRAPIRSGFTDPNGITYVFPIEDWTRPEVLRYAREHCPDWLPEYYAAGEPSSRDCWDCTAYRDDNQLRLKRLPPDKRALLEDRVAEWKQRVRSELEV